MPTAAPGRLHLLGPRVKKAKELPGTPAGSPDRRLPQVDPIDGYGRELVDLARCVGEIAAARRLTLSELRAACIAGDGETVMALARMLVGLED